MNNIRDNSDLAECRDLFVKMGERDYPFINQRLQRVAAFAKFTQRVGQKSFLEKFFSSKSTPKNSECKTLT